MRNTMIGKHKGSFGYSIVELAVVIAVAGILLGSFGSAYNLYVTHKVQARTELNSGLITSALSNFLIQKGRYPCPARMNAKRTDPDYGLETQCDPLAADPTPGPYPMTGVLPTAISFGTCVNGVCFEQSTAYQTINNYFNALLPDGKGCVHSAGATGATKLFCPGDGSGATVPAKITIQPPVRRGVIPFRTLALPEDAAYDGYNNRFAYAVAENQAVTKSYEPNKGGVEVLNAQGQKYFSVYIPTPILRPDGYGPHSYVQWHTPVDYHAVQEMTVTTGTSASPPANSTTVLPVGSYIWGKPKQFSSIEFTMSNPIGAPPVGVATLSFTAAEVDTTGALKSDLPAMTPWVTIRENNVILANLNKAHGAPGCAAAFPTMNGTWHQYDCAFDGSLVTDWANVTVEIGNDVKNTTSGGRNIGIGWVQLQLAPPIVGYTDYFLFSPGKDRANAYTREGQVPVPCNLTTLDGQNCKTKVLAQYRMAEENDPYVADPAVCNTANCHFDDYVKFFSSTETPLWRISGTGAHIRDLVGVENGAAKVAVAMQPSASSAAVLQVAGNTHARSAAAMMSKACDINDGNCFYVGSMVDGTFTCPPGQYAVGFDTGTMKCQAGSSVPCAPGQVMTGVNPDGSLICTSVVGCPSVTANLCLNPSTGITDSAIIPSGVQNQTYTTPSSGYNYVETWTCNLNNNGTWAKSSSTGICNCTPVDTTYNVACNSVAPFNNGNFTGNVLMHHVHVCPADTDSVTQVSNTCLCAPTTQTMTDFNACGVGFTGSITYTRDFTCTTTTTGSFTAWTQTANNCVCQAQAPQTRTLNCPTQPSTGQITQTNTFTCPAGTWSGWTTTSNTCACNNGATQTQNLGCQAGYTGTHTQTQTYNCATSSWSAWVDTVNTCSCSPQTQTQSLSCSTGYSGAIAQHRDFTCPGATWGGWVTDSNTCTCTGASQTQTVPCGAPLLGQKTQQRDFNCGTNAWSAWYDTSTAACYLTTYNWTPKTAADGPYGTALPVHAGDLCTTAGATSPCSASAPSGLGFYHYATCQCE